MNCLSCVSVLQCWVLLGSAQQDISLSPITKITTTKQPTSPLVSCQYTHTKTFLEGGVVERKNGYCYCDNESLSLFEQKNSDQCPISNIRSNIIGTALVPIILPFHMLRDDDDRGGHDTTTTITTKLAMDDGTVLFIDTITVITTTTVSTATTPTCTTTTTGTIHFP